MSDVCVYIQYVLCLWSDWFCRLTWQGWYICEKSLEMCICLWPEFDCPDVTLCGWQDIKIQLLLLLLLFFFFLLLSSSFFFVFFFFFFFFFLLLLLLFLSSSSSSSFFFLLLLSSSSSSSSSSFVVVEIPYSDLGVLVIFWPCYCYLYVAVDCSSVLTHSCSF